MSTKNAKPNNTHAFDATPDFQWIHVDKLTSHPDNVGIYGATFVDEAFAQSVRDHGIQQPIIVWPQDDGKYIIISGHRRTAAAELAGINRVPCYVRQYDSKTESSIALVEGNRHNRHKTNGQKNLEVLALKAALETLAKERKKAGKKAVGGGGSTKSQIAAQTGMSEREVDDRIVVFDDTYRNKKIATCPEDDQERVLGFWDDLRVRVNSGAHDLGRAAIIIRGMVQKSIELAGVPIKPRRVKKGRVAKEAKETEGFTFWKTRDPEEKAKFQCLFTILDRTDLKVGMYTIDNDTESLALLDFKGNMYVFNYDTHEPFIRHRV